MAMRNFWVDADIDGRKEHLSGGPQSKSGGFRCRFYWRDQGEIRGPIAIWGTVGNDGSLRLELVDQNGETTQLAKSTH